MEDLDDLIVQLVKGYFFQKKRELLIDNGWMEISKGVFAKDAGEFTMRDFYLNDCLLPTEERRVYRR